VARLPDKSAVITGGASGIGRAAAQRFRAEGAAVVVADLEPGAERDFIRCDVTSAEDVNRLADQALERFGRVDIVFANAGFAAHHDSTTMSEEQWERVFEVDVKGVWLVCRAFLPCMLERGAGTIIVTASQLGLVGYPGLAAYTAAKGAVINLVRSLAAETGSRGVRINALCPGPTLTPGLQAWLDQVDDPRVLQRLAESSRHSRRSGYPEWPRIVRIAANDHE
jgi:NAD(P)-dependent dehydrogenase (short-subunit alcohol dehydrogenase family)